VLVGSSKIRIRASASRTRTISTRCCSESESVPARRLLWQKERDVLRHRERRDQRGLLEDEPDPEPSRISRTADLYRLPVEQQLALVRLLVAVEDLHECALAGAILAEQCVHTGP
jgi:hypothetical protein